MEDKVLLITGASSDVGLKIIEKLNQNYQVIYAHYANDDSKLRALQTALGEKLILVKDDFSLETAGKEILEVIEEKNIWPNHIIHLPAPKLVNERFTKTVWTDYEKNMYISFKSCINLFPTLLKKITKEKKEGRIVFMLSSCVENTPPKFMTPYVTTKYALLGLMKSLSVEYCSKRIMVNAISPGMMETKFLENTNEHIIEQNAANSPFGRNLMVDEIISTFEYLLLDGSARVTGQNIVVSGGM